MAKIIECRYEHRVRTGKVFTQWFKYDTITDTELTDKEILKKAKNEVKTVDKVTKLKHEFRIVEGNGGK